MKFPSLDHAVDDIDKGRAAQQLAGLLGLEMRSTAGIGDSDPDLSFLRCVGFSAAPDNATAAVRQAVHYVARAAYGQGLLEVLDLIASHNRSLGRAEAAE